MKLTPHLSATFLLCQQYLLFFLELMIGLSNTLTVVVKGISNKCQVGENDQKVRIGETILKFGLQISAVPGK